MNKIVADLIDQVAVRRPIFDVEVRQGEISFVSPSQVDQPLATNVDPIAQLVARFAQDRFSAAWREFRVDKDYVSRRVYDCIMDEIKVNYIRCSPLKQPQSSKTYKWLRRQEFSRGPIASDVWIMLYRYMMTSAPAGRCLTKDNPNGVNLVNIIEAMREKYER